MSDELNGSAYCCVSFEADVLIYLKGEIITGCTIRKIESGGQTYAESKYCSLQFKQDPALSIYKENSIIPAVVDKARYYPNKDKISIGALPFAPIFPPLIIYKIGDSHITESQKQCLNLILDKISQYENKIKNFSKIETKSYEFFRNLLYPFKKVQLLDKSETYKNMNFKILEFEKMLNNDIKDGFICRPIELEKFLPKFYYSNKINDAKISTQITENTLYEITIIMLQDYLQYLILLCEMVEFYPDFKTIEKYAKVWQMYNMLKK
jgi:hypothetical protein